MSLQFRPPIPAGQTVGGSVVFGDVVQVSDVAGDVHVTTDRPPYRVETFAVNAAVLSPARARAQPSRLLLPRYQAVPFTGRDSELADLATWMSDTSQPVAVRLVHAAGGQGKTRLAGHVAQVCARAGWAVWRVLHSPSPVAGADRVTLPAEGGAVVVVDYADRWPASHLLALLTNLRGLTASTGMVLRVLLLARSAGFWWPALADRLDGDLDVAADVCELAPLGRAEVDRVGLFHTAAEHFAVAMGLPTSATLPPPRGLNGPGYAQVLAVHMAALVAVDAHQHGAAQPTEPHAVSAYLLRREYTHWHILHARTEDRIDTPPTVMRRAVCAATLTGALPRAAAHTALRRIKLVSTPETADQILDDHGRCYPPENLAMVLEALHPDRLGEDFLALSTPGHPHTDDSIWRPDAWVTDAVPALLCPTDDTLPVWAPAAVTVLVETAHRWPHIAERVLYPLLRQHPQLAITAGGATLTRLTDLPNVDIGVLEAIEPFLPDNRHADLDTAAAALTAALTPHRLAATTDPVQHALLHATLGYRLANAGQRWEALAATEKAVQLRRRLAQTDPAAYEPDLAASLNNQGAMLSDLGQRQEALAATEEAVQVYRRLAQTDPAAYEPDLAASLNNQGAMLSDLGQRQEAWAAAEEAVEVYRRLAGANPAAYEPDLAMSLHNHGMTLSRLEQRQEALAATEEAVQVYRRLAQTDPAAYEPDLAASLNNQGAMLSRLGRRQEALAATEEAVEVYRRLAGANPAAYEPDLAMSLHNHGMTLSRLERQQEAWAAAEEAIQFRRRLARTNPPAYEPDLAKSLNSRGKMLSALGRHHEAHAATEEAVQIYRWLTKTNPAAYEPDLAASLNNFGIRLSRLGQRQESWAATAEAVQIYRRLAGANPAAYEPDLAMSLHNNGIRLSALGRHHEAHAATDQAVQIYRRLAETNPAAFEPDLAGALWGFASVRAASGADLPTALSAAAEAVAVYQRLATRHPHMFLADLRSAEATHADVLNGLGGHEDADDIRHRLDDASDGGGRRRHGFSL